MNNKLSTSRRSFLSTGLKAAGGITLVVSGGVVYKAISEDIFSPIDGPAYEAWDDWNQLQPGAIGLVQVAILAANPHNTQPWRFKISETEIEIYADKERNLGSFDPFRREMHLGLGCAIENLSLAAQEHGYATDIQYETGELTLNQNDTGIELAARVKLTPAQVDSNPLYQVIPKRHTNRYPYLPTPVDETFLTSLKNEATSLGLRLDLFAPGNKHQEFVNLMNDATDWIIEDSEMVHDSHQWFRFNKTQVEEYRDGPTIDGIGIPTAMAAASKLLPEVKPKVAHEMWAKATRTSHLPNTPIVGIISVTNRYNKEASLDAGRFWQRLHLLATREDLACHPMNQPNEWIDRLYQLNKPNVAEERMTALIGSSEWQSTFTFRMGYSTSPAPKSPRRELADRLIKA